MTNRISLTRTQLRELERDLARERARLERSLHARSGAEDGSPFGSGAMPAHADSGAGGVVVEDRTLARHQALTDALRRIEAGTYGTCVSCRGPIPYGRLLAIPEATHCLACGLRA